MKAFVPAAALLVSATALAASADEVFLAGGGRIVGQVVERRADAIVIDVGAGRVTLPASRVARVTSGASALSVYRERAARLHPRDSAGWLALGLWARDNDLMTLARESFERAVAADRSNDAAHRALGHVLLGDQWMSAEESYRARGFVSYEGEWMPPEQAQMLAGQRMAEAEARRAEREAAARAREAEARAEAAEADAARAAAEAEAAAGGIPYEWVFGPGYGPYGPYSPYGPYVVNPYGGNGAGPVRGHGGMRGGRGPGPGQGSGSSVRPPRSNIGSGTPTRPASPAPRAGAKGVPDRRL